jgi:hypothetical protein
MKPSRWRTLGLLGLGLGACSLTHSLDDLRGGVAVAGSSSGGDAATGGTNGKAGSAGVAATEGGDAAGNAAAGAGGGSEPPTGPHLITPDPVSGGKQGFLEPLELQFSDVMDLTTLSGDALCKGSVRLRKQGNQLCIALKPAVAIDGRPAAYSLDLMEQLEVGQSYELTVTTDATTQDGVPLESTADVSLQAVYRHTIKMDGANDFLPGETLMTSSGGYTAYIAWDRQALYLGMQGAQIPKKEQNGGLFAISYLAWPGASPSTMAAQTYKAVSPMLDFAATHYVRWKGDQSGASLFTYTGPGQWEESPFNNSKGQEFRQNGEFLELKVPFDVSFSQAVSADQPLKLVMFLLNETTGAESTYAAAPGVTGGDTTTPQLPKHFELTLVDSPAFPKDSPILP